MQNLYDLLGVRPDDDVENLRNAFRKAAKAHHPDHHGGDPEATARFRRIAQAYDILRDEAKRAAYDRLLEIQLEIQRKPLRSKAKRAISHPAYQFGFNAIAAVVVGIVLAAGYTLLAHISGTSGDDIGRMIARRLPWMAAAEPAGPADTAKQDALPDRPERAPQMPIATPVIQGPGAAALALKDRGALEAATGPDAEQLRNAEHLQVPERAAPVLSQDESCKRDAARLAHLRISQERNEIIRFETELDCDKLRPQVTRLRESADSAMEDRGALEATTGLNAARQQNTDHSQVPERAAPVLSQDGICKRDAARLAHLRISQERNEIIRFETELDCDKLRPQVTRLRESVDSP